MFIKYGEVFKTYNQRINNRDFEYNGWQGYFHMNFFNGGYEVKDISDISPIVYRRGKTLLTFSSQTYTMSNLGHVNIMPIL